MKRSAFGIFFAFILGLSFIFIKPVLAAEPQALFSWKAQNYVPVWYEGKSFPINRTTITASFEAVSQSRADFGKIIDLSNTDIKWYFNNNLVKEGNNLKTISVVKDDFPRNVVNIKVSFNFSDSDSGENYVTNQYLAIPIYSPDVVILTNKQDLTTSVNGILNLKAVPFFFNAVSDYLNLNWSVNGQSVPLGSDPYGLDLKIGSDVPYQQARINISASNPDNVLEQASKSILFNVMN